MPKKQTLEPAIIQNCAKTLRDARITMGISQRELSTLVGITQPLISAWEHGKSVPSLHHLVAIEEALSLSTGALIMPIAYPDHHGNISAPE
jgi:transcriptional regulator with XRE-family HTH domain